ncbi:MAG: isoprenylcysteine carboxylmethyltransferase family protein [Pseudomonadota bacterium]
MLKWIDIPPMWLLACAVLAWVQAEFAPMGLSFGAGWAVPVGTGLVVVGLIVMALALLEFTRRRTTPIPHMEASHLITTGVFAYSRNPIYLADVIILTGLILRWDAVLAVPLIPALAWIITHRFILPEEARLERGFGDAFLRYRGATRRWL